MYVESGDSRIYLTMPFILYVIEFPNGKRYFGITERSLDERWRDHHKVARRNYSRRICAALRKYRDAKIRCLVVGGRDYIHALEIAAIRAFQTQKRSHGYNVGDGGDYNPMLGQKHTLEAREKIGKAGRMRIRTAESKAKTSASLRGHRVSDETRAKIRAKLKGIPQPTRRKNTGQLSLL